MSKMRNAVLMVAVIAMLAAVLCVQAPVAQAAPAAGATSIGPGGEPDIAFPASRNGFVSEEELWREFFHVAELHDGRLAQQLLPIICMRQAHRVHLPRWGLLRRATHRAGRA